MAPSGPASTPGASHPPAAVHDDRHIRVGEHRGERALRDAGGDIPGCRLTVAGEAVGDTQAVEEVERQPTDRVFDADVARTEATCGHPADVPRWLEEHHPHILAGGRRR